MTRRRSSSAGEAQRRAAAAARRPEPPAVPDSASSADFQAVMAQRHEMQRDVERLQALAALSRLAGDLADLDAQRAALLERRDAAVERSLGLGASMVAAARAAGTTRQALMKRRDGAPVEAP